MRDEQLYCEYDAALREFMSGEPLVPSWVAGSPEHRSGEGVEMKAGIIGLDLSQAHLLPLERTGRDVNQALLWSRQGDGIRGLFVTTGAAVLPSSGANRAGEGKDTLILSVAP